MRIKSLRKSKQDDEHTIFSFECGRDEIKLMRDLLWEDYKKIPKAMELTSTRSRLRSILREMDAIINEFIQ